jgi:hypothetical protein
MAGVAGGGAVDAEADTFDPDDPNAAQRALQRWARNMARQQAAVAAASRQRGSNAWTMLDSMTRRPSPPAVERLAALGQAESEGMRRTREAVRRQVDAFRACGVAHFEVGTIPPKGSPLARERLRRFDAPTLLRSVAWLRAQNAKGYDCYVRPLARNDGLAPPLSFLDDLDAEGVARAEREGCRFAVLIESSPGRYHGWIRISDRLIPQEELTAAGRELARRFSGDPASIDWRHFGRLAGYTNRKPARAVAGKGQPFALLRKISAEVAPVGAEILMAARAALAAEKAAAQAAADRRQRVAAAGGERALGDAAAAFQTQRRRFGQTKDTGELDESRRDMSAAMAMLRRGYSPGAVTAAMLENSAEIAARGHDPHDYTRRTVEKAQQWAERQEQTTQAQALALKPPAPMPPRKDDNRDKTRQGGA